MNQIQSFLSLLLVEHYEKLFLLKTILYILNNRDFVKVLIIKINANVQRFEIILTSFSRILMHIEHQSLIFNIKKYNGTIEVLLGVKRENKIIKQTL